MFKEVSLVDYINKVYQSSRDATQQSDTYVYHHYS